jgi:hypothetical protein
MGNTKSFHIYNENREEPHENEENEKDVENEEKDVENEEKDVENEEKSFRRYNNEMEEIIRERHRVYAEETRNNLDEPYQVNQGYPNLYETTSNRPVSYRLPETPAFMNHDNGWDNNANETIQSWFNTCKEFRWRYQFILDRNYWLAGQLNTISIVSSSLLSIFSGFKLWTTQSDFQSASNIIMLISNSFVAGVTTLSKKYIDDSRNEKIRNFIESMDKFIGNLHAQVTVAPIYRMQSYTFIQQNIAEYTRLMTNCPNLSTSELLMAKEKYGNYLKNIENKNKK